MHHTLNGNDMRIAEAAERSGLTIATIRYYEGSGLVPEIRRGSDGQRRFTPENVDWLTLLYWLRETGMSMKVMHQFASLYQRGDSTMSERKDILLNHSKYLEKKRKDLDHCEEILAYKIALYKDLEK
jgi:DNA-binding transcriptional MerR regulator